MIEFAFEVSLRQLELMNYGDYYFLLAHLFKDPRYREFVHEKADQERIWMLDNSAFELGESVDLSWLVSIAMDLSRLDVLVVPDKLGSFKKTIELCKKFVNNEDVRYLIAQRRPWLMVVAQSGSGQVEELVSCLMIQESLVKYHLGYSKVVYGLPRKYAGSLRIECAKRLSGLRKTKWIHFLGCPDLDDLKAITTALKEEIKPRCKFTLDTSLPFRLALQDAGLEGDTFELEVSEALFKTKVEVVALYGLGYYEGVR